MVNILIIGDPHFKVSNVRDTDLMTESIINKVIETNPDIIVVLGDILDRHETIHVTPLTKSIIFLARLCEIKPVYVLMGNHDLKNNRQFLSEEHPFVSLKYWDQSKITVVDKVTKCTIDDKLFVFVPYVPPGRFVEALNTIEDWENATAIFAHQEFRGAQMGGIISVDGDKWNEKYPYVISGHVHDYQLLQSNILYTGTPIQHSFGDNHDKTISYMSFTSSDERLHSRIDLGIPKKIIIRILCEEVTNYVPPENKDLKIIIRGTSGEIKAIMKHPNVDMWKKIGYKICYKDIPINYKESENKSIISKAPLNFSTVLYNAIKTNKNLECLYKKMFDKHSDNKIESLKLPIKLVITNKI